MKNTSLILSIIALVVAGALAIVSLVNKTPKAAPVVNNADGQEATIGKGSIVYFDQERLIREYDMANELSSTVESKVQGIQQEVTRRGNKLQNDVNAYQDKINKGLMTRSTAEEQGRKLQSQQDSFNNYAAQKQQEIAEEQQVMLNQIGDAIKTYIDKFNAVHQYALIIATQGGVLPFPVAAGDPALDITDALIQGLNEEYVSTKAKNNKAE